MSRGPRVRLVRDALRQLRDRVGTGPLVILRTELPRDQGRVVTTLHWDYRSPTGKRYRSVASWPDGTVAERRWSEYEVDAQTAHKALEARQRRRLPPEEGDG